MNMIQSSYSSEIFVRTNYVYILIFAHVGLLSTVKSVYLWIKEPSM